MPRHETEALPEDKRIAVVFLEWHLAQRGKRDDPTFERLADGGLGTFLTTGYVQAGLRAIDAPKTGKDFAAEIKNEILPRLGLLEPTGEVRKPRAEKAHPGKQRETGGRHAQPNELRSYWWPVFRLPTLERLLAGLSGRRGAYPSHPGHSPHEVGKSEASLFRLLRCQGLIWERRGGRGRPSGQIQRTHWATGPP
jgi:hypothetical protein